MLLRYPRGVGRSRSSLPPRLFDNVAALRRRLTTQMDGSLSVFQELELSLPQAMAVMQLAERGPMSFSQLEKAVGRSQAATSHMVEQLEQRGLVERHQDPDDKRRRVVVIAPDGRRAVGRIEQVRRAALETVFGGVPGPVLARFDRALREVLEALEG